MGSRLTWGSLRAAAAPYLNPQVVTVAHCTDADFDADEAR